MRRRTPNMLSRGCFSLMEIMIAVTILGMVSTLIYSSFARSLEIPQYLRNIQERYHKVRIAMDRMTSEIAMAYLSKHVDPNTDESPRYIFRLENKDPGDRLDFTAFAHTKLYADVDESDQCEIGFFLEEDPEKKDVLNLMRREQKRIDEEPGWGGKKMILADDVEDFEVQIWDEGEKEWVEEWDTSQIEQFEKIPRIVQIELTILDENGKEITFYTKTQIMLQKPVDLVSI